MMSKGQPHDEENNDRTVQLYHHKTISMEVDKNNQIWNHIFNGKDEIAYFCIIPETWISLSR